MRQEYSRDTERYGGSFVDVAFDLPHGLDLDQLTVQLDRMISSYQSQLQSSEAVLVAPEKRPPIVVSLDDAVKDLFVDRDRFELLLDQLDKKKNVILQGPPGVGKTFFAQRLAQVFAGGDDPNRVRLVQFHASYAYEDFVQGYSIGHSSRSPQVSRSRNRGLSCRPCFAGGSCRSEGAYSLQAHHRHNRAAERSDFHCGLVSADTRTCARSGDR